eukprot:572625-Rhodomonas_salina.1
MLLVLQLLQLAELLLVSSQQLALSQSPRHPILMWRKHTVKRFLESVNVTPRHTRGGRVTVDRREEVTVHTLQGMHRPEEGGGKYSQITQLKLTGRTTGKLDFVKTQGSQRKETELTMRA